MMKSPYAPELVTPAGAPLLTRSEAKLHCRVEEDNTLDDTLIDGLIGATTTHIDGYSGVLGRCLINQVWRVRFDSWASCLRLPFPDVSAVVVKWLDDDGIETTVDAGGYKVPADHIGSYVRFSDGYSPPADVAAVRGWAVEATAGYGASAAAVPQAIRQAALLMVGNWYINREAVNVGNIVTPLPFAVDALLAPYRRVGL